MFAVQQYADCVFYSVQYSMFFKIARHTVYEMIEAQHVFPILYRTKEYSLAVLSGMHTRCTSLNSQVSLGQCCTVQIHIMRWDDAYEVWRWWRVMERERKPMVWGGGVTQYNAVYHNVWKCSYISYSNCTVLIISKHCDRLRHYWSISIVQTSFDYVFQWTLRKWFVLHLDCVRKPCLIIVLHLEPLWIYKKVSVWICLDDVIRGCGHFDGHQHTHRVKSQRNWSHSI